MSIPTPLSNTTITTDGSGNVSLTSIYSPAATGQYDVIVKLANETDGTYDVQDLLITNVVATPGPGLNVLPEYEIAVTKVTSYKTIIGRGYGGNVTVKTENLGTAAETFNVTLYANSTYVTSQNVTIFSSGNSASVTFTWNTTGFAYGNYTVSAYAWPVPGQTNTTNNSLTGGTVYVGIPGDLNGAGTVNILDAIILSNAFLSTPGSTNWNPNADINGDGVVNILDAILLSNNFGTTVP
jgi:hypothetical protein